MLSLWFPFGPSNHKSDRLSAKDYFDRLVENSFNEALSDFMIPYTNSFGIEQKQGNGFIDVIIDMPGVKESDLSVEVIDNIVSINAERNDRKSKRVIKRSFSIKEGYDPDSISATLDNGVLTLRLLEKPKEEKKIKKIEIKSQKALPAPE